MEVERENYERAVGRVNTSYKMLHLVMHDPAFAWLHNLSELVVQIDELLDSDQESREAEAVALLDQARLLLVPSETGDDFQRKYYEALQQSPDVVLTHSEAVKLLGKKPSEIH
jgi:hypothetical protein